MEEVFAKLHDFQREYEKLKLISQKNEKILLTALNEAKSVINSLDIKAGRETEKEDSKRYMNISLSNIEMALRFKSS